MKRKYLLLILAFFISGCVTTGTFRVSPFLEQKIPHIKTIAVMPMDVKVYKVTAGGVQELVDEFSNEAKSNIRAALQEELTNKRNFGLEYLPDLEEIKNADFKQKAKEAMALFEAVNKSIRMHTYQPGMAVLPYQGILKDKVKNFDYTLGPQVKTFAESKKSDSILFIKGGDYVSTGGRMALMAWVAVLEALAGGGYSSKSAGPPHLYVALVDAETGDVLWYDYYLVQTGYNFRNSKSVSTFVKTLLKNFPKR